MHIDLSRCSAHIPGRVAPVKNDSHSVTVPEPSVHMSPKPVEARIPAIPSQRAYNYAIFA